MSSSNQVTFAPDSSSNPPFLTPLPQLTNYRGSLGQVPVGRYLRMSIQASTGLLLVAFVYFLLVKMPVSYGDWIRFFRPASLAVANPYSVEGILNPPWTFALLNPLARLPERWGGAGLALLSSAAIVLYARSPWKVLAISLSAPFLFVLILGQLDALILYGLMLPAAFGSVLILIKPQSAALTMLKRLDRKTLFALGMALLISFLVWGFWPLQMFRFGIEPDSLRNASLFPYSLPLAPVLVYFGIRRKSDALLCWATLCAVPFFQTHSILPAIAVSVRESSDWKLWLALPILSWLYYALYLGWVN